MGWKEDDLKVLRIVKSVFRFVRNDWNQRVWAVTEWAEAKTLEFNDYSQNKLCRC